MATTIKNSSGTTIALPASLSASSATCANGATVTSTKTVAQVVALMGGAPPPGVRVYDSAEEAGDGSVTLTDPNHAHGGATGAGAAHTHAFTGTVPPGAEVESVAGTGYATAGQVVTTTENFTATLNQYAFNWLLVQGQPPCFIESHPAVTGAPLELTVFGAAPPTGATAFKILRAPTPAGTNANESAHTHTVASGATGITLS